MWVFQSNVARIILFLDILASKADVATRTFFKITMAGPTICMTNGSSRPYSQSVGGLCKLEDIKFISGSIQ